MNVKIRTCPVCDSENSEDIARDNNVPLYNLSYQESLTKAIDVPKVEVYFVRCKNCGFVFNCVYDQLDHSNTPCIIDMNEDLWGRFTAGNGIKVVSPEILFNQKFKAVINLNPLYQEEIEGRIKSMNLNIEVINIFK